ncbi:MAG: hypothetical protein IRY95_03360, partial [Clostridia bacterium]|nr:hypothetical protein [Clostridia bacterium]
MAMFDTVPFGLVLVVAAGVLLFLGVGQRVLDRMKLTDTQALILLGVMVLGVVLPEVPVAPGVRADVGGVLAPLAVVVYLLATAGTAWERQRALLASAVALAAVYATDKLLPADPGRAAAGLRVSLDPLWVPAVVGAA